MTRRRGLGKGMGMGYKNLVPKDSYVHSMSAKGVKFYEVSPQVQMVATAKNRFDAIEKASTELEKNPKVFRVINYFNSPVRELDEKRYPLLKKFDEQGKIIHAKGKGNIFASKKVLTESEINLAKRRLNNGKITHEDIFGEDYEPKRLTPEQTKKGYDFLIDQWKTPEGVERKNNPFGYREEAILDKFDHFELIDYYNASNYYQSQAGINFYVPVYRVVAKDGYRFDYYYDGKVNIIG